MGRYLDRFPPRDIAILFPRVNEAISHSPMRAREREKKGGREEEIHHAYSCAARIFSACTSDKNKLGEIA